MSFQSYASAVQKHFDKLQNTTGIVLVRADVDGEELVNLYQDSFPSGKNEIFRERLEHDCNCCNSFIKRLGNVIAIDKNLKLHTIWDFDVKGIPEEYVHVSKILSAHVKSKPIKSYFSTDITHVGQVSSPDKETNIKWYHFNAIVLRNYVLDGSTLGELETTYSVVKRGLVELSIDAAKEVYDLIQSNSLYRGNEFKKSVSDFIAAKEKFDKVPANEQDIYLRYMSYKKLSRFRSTVIGTLVEEITGGKDITNAVASFEAKVAPTNYKRPTAVVTPKMVESAREEIEKLGLMDALHRRYAVPTDISVNNVLYTSYVDKPLNVFDEIVTEQKASRPTKQQLAKATNISLKDFIETVLPSSNNVELLFEPRLTSKLFSLIAPTDEESASLFKWNNKYSWAYSGNLTDTNIKDRVAKFGGDVNGDVRISLSWFNATDQDLFVHEPTGHKISYGNRTKVSSCGGFLDLDMNGLDKHSDTEPVENVIYKNSSKMKPGVYKIGVNCYHEATRDRPGIELEIEINGEVRKFVHEKNYNASHKTLIDLTVDKNGDISITSVDSSLEETSAAGKEVWGVVTGSFVPVTMVLNSPNYWDNQTIGNKHTFFVIENCKNPDAARGFFNEYLRDDLTQHRKAFELLSSKLAIPASDGEQVSGLGFSESISDSFVVRVKNKGQRLYKVSTI